MRRAAMSARLLVSIRGATATPAQELPPQAASKRDAAQQQAPSPCWAPCCTGRRTTAHLLWVQQKASPDNKCSHGSQAAVDDQGHTLRHQHSLSFLRQPCWPGTGLQPTVSVYIARGLQLGCPAVGDLDCHAGCRVIGGCLGGHGAGQCREVAAQHLHGSQDRAVGCSRAGQAPCHPGLRPTRDCRSESAREFCAKPHCCVADQPSSVHNVAAACPELSSSWGIQTCGSSVWGPMLTWQGTPPICTAVWKKSVSRMTAPPGLAARGARAEPVSVMRVPPLELP